MQKKSRLMRPKAFEIVSNIFLSFWTVFCLLPVILLIISSLTKESVIAQYGYSFLPREWDISAYEYLWNHGKQIVNAYKITFIVTALGTFLSLVVTTSFAYALSRNETPFGKITNFLVFFSMLFNGGMVASYLTWTEIFHVRDTIWALILPNLLMNGFHVMIMKNYFRTTIHPAIVESAKMDGASEFTVFFYIILPLSLPIIATIGLFSGLGYWNDWINGLYYVNDTDLYSIQYLLNQMIENVMLLSSGAFGAKAAEQVSKLPSSGIRMAIAVIGMLPILVIYPFFQKYFAKGIAIGAVKE